MEVFDVIDALISDLGWCVIECVVCGSFDRAGHYVGIRLVVGIDLQRRKL